MSIQIFDTMHGKKRDLVPMVDGRLGIYVCGMTVYDRCHLGHGRVMVSFDTIVRYLRYRGFDVTYVRNITDLDDKIFARAAEQGIPFTELTDAMIEAMHADEARLGCAFPDQEPRATHNIPSMLALMTTLVEKGAAYQGSSGDLYFRVSAFPAYGKLNNRRVDEMEAGARVAVASDKESPADFVLWKKAKAGEASWPSAFGEGRPGWHIECSAMSMDALGPTFDIHGGGPDLKFPHHENEIAQSEAATGQCFARYWMHAGAVRVRDEKMSKSLGNFITLEALFAEHHPAVIRFFLLQSHYRSAIVYTEDAIQTADVTYSKLIHAFVEGIPNVPVDGDAMMRFQAVMDDDFNTPQAIALMFELVKRADPEALAAAHRMGQVLGLFGQDAAQFAKERQQLKAQHSALSDEAVTELIEQRRIARAEKQFAEADRIRDHLAECGIVIEDSVEGTRWSRQ